MIAESLRLNELAQVPHLTIDICQAQARLFLAQAEAVEQSLVLAAPMGCVRLFLDEGPELIALVASASKRPKLAVGTQEFIRRILAQSPEHRPEASLRPGSLVGAALVEPLTPREQEVLTLLAAGCSNQDIAERLAITLASVKKHAGSIYGKLAVSSRTQAVVRARQVGLLGDQTPIPWHPPPVRPVD